MGISKDKVVQFYYTLRDEAGELLESNVGADPVAYLHGHKNMMPGVEKALEGREAGGEFTVTLPPEETYGVRRENSEQRVPVKHLMGAKRWKPGMMAVVQTEQGQRQVTVIKVGKFMVTVDTNHPMAGKTLTFDMVVADVRDATSEEIAHGHAHGIGGHHH
ncbi:FKBP-type peptidyl-prolyl cis-trans isomerase [Oceanospirillum linum]|uniref:Peptidyl-prolyl cis-trans isomerase n=1 Tax=Oceanospirillum linum TaxID=966 RepID=A0A1T1HAA2_OCELI|nr:peptidylprolyl isomerase [Oceanospirillum linum]OOV86762.1 peptidylprolyl isomerase [Oceanospirillum linum]SEG23277.1 FKBP-type peptidyl-prolyl cis-trans isomerase SlyD [Oleiphilus messinensis]SMP25544.1 FKBP-type peptidyl-prolyl cis-trans isomerase SlyD [Oceanospirillum linum]